MAEMELYIDDNVVIPEEIMRMTKEERQRLIGSGVKLPKL